jgi:tryptophanyl-tRNA synthetase
LTGKKLTKAVGQIVTDSTPLGQPLPLTRMLKETLMVRREDGEGYAEVEQQREVPETTYALLELLCGPDELAQIRGWYASGRRDGAEFGWGHAKRLLAQKIDEHFAEARARREHFLAHPEQVEAVLQRSAERARSVARATVEACRRACGLR